MTNNQIISSEFPFKSRFINVFGSKLHYIEEGEGDPILFLHGMPASSYLWRNIIPTMSKYANCIALDLIGMGKSDKPNISYSIDDHIKYINEFIKLLDLQKITLVLHGIGSIIGFNYAAQHPDNIQGIVFYESYVGDFDDWKKLSLPVQELLSLIKAKSDPIAMIADKNLINKIFNSASLRKLTAKELQIYNEPFTTVQDRKVLAQFIKDSPFVDKNNKVSQIIAHYTHYLENSSVPKLMLFTVPGFLITIQNVIWCQQHLKNLTLIDLGQGLHFVQEYNPEGFSDALVNWYTVKVLEQEKEFL